jgi:hypothetical protein
MKYKFVGNVSQAQINWGSHTDPRGLLEEGKVYDVKNIEVRSWHTKVFLKGYKGHFNSVWFEEV